jgi:hypothetical protein
MENTLFVCECGDVDHQFIISFDQEEGFNDTIFFQIHLGSVGFWNRLKYSIRYLLGKKSRYNGGSFSEVLLDKKQTKELIDILNKHLERMK